MNEFLIVRKNLFSRGGDAMQEISVEDFFGLVESFYRRIEEDDDKSQDYIGEHAKFRSFINEYAEGLCGCDDSSLVAVLFDTNAEWSSELPAKLPVSEILQCYDYEADCLVYFDLDDIDDLTHKRYHDLVEEIYNHISYKLVVGIYMLYYHY